MNMILKVSSWFEDCFIISQVRKSENNSMRMVKFDFAIFLDKNLVVNY